MSSVRAAYSSISSSLRRRWEPSIRLEYRTIRSWVVRVVLKISRRERNKEIPSPQREGLLSNRVWDLPSQQLRMAVKRYLLRSVFVVKGAMSWSCTS